MATNNAANIATGAASTVLTGQGVGSNPTFSGTPTVTSITFGSGNALSTYVKTTWTPTLTFGGGSTGITYTTRIGTYATIGNVLFFSFQILLSSKGSSTGTAQMTGFPTSATAGTEVAVIPYVVGLTINAGNTVIVGAMSGTSMNLFEDATVGTGLTNLTDTNFGNTTELRCNGFYFV